jgi:hypothetical protein
MPCGARLSAACWFGNVLPSRGAPMFRNVSHRECLGVSGSRHAAVPGSAGSGGASRPARRPFRAITDARLVPSRMLRRVRRCDTGSAHPASLLGPARPACPSYFSLECSRISRCAGQVRHTRLTRFGAAGRTEGVVDASRGRFCLGRASGCETFARFLPHTPSSNASSLPPAPPCKPRPVLPFAVIAACSDRLRLRRSWLSPAPFSPSGSRSPGSAPLLGRIVVRGRARQATLLAG